MNSTTSFTLCNKKPIWLKRHQQNLRDELADLEFGGYLYEAINKRRDLCKNLDKYRRTNGKGLLPYFGVMR